MEGGTKREAEEEENEAEEAEGEEDTVLQGIVRIDTAELDKCVVLESAECVIPFSPAPFSTIDLVEVARAVFCSGSPLLASQDSTASPSLSGSVHRSPATATTPSADPATTANSAAKTVFCILPRVAAPSPGPLQGANTPAHPPHPNA